MLDQDYLIAAMRYVERNPVRAKRVHKPWQWKWSSAGAHVGQADGVVNLVDMRKFMDVTRKAGGSLSIRTITSVIWKRLGNTR